MRASDIQIEWDEDGCYIIIDGDSVDPDYQAGCYRWRVEDPEQLYDRVKGAIGPWLYEKEQAFQEFRQAVRSGTGPAAEFFACKDPEGDWIADQRDAYVASDPKHPDYHSVHADLWDAREGK